VADRRLRVAQLLLLLAALGLWGASRLTWVSLTSADGLGQPRSVALTGADWSTGLVPLALLLAAVAVAALAVRGVLLRVLALLLAASVAAVGYLGVSQWVIPDVRPRAAELSELPMHTLVAVDRHYPGAVLTLVAALLGLAAAVLLLRAASAASAGDGRYASPGARRDDAARAADAQTPMSERMMWDAIDEGHDPTASDPGSQGR
jgi:uncharacterized membrane protein (TIGR02234 family)